ncbi:amidohydrolase family protein [Asanoa sp. NPDC050611]|uniref:amidohydrolase family protein n=1 Tax=Asanoa sp. NPDC050611 TaxID=3157098 RepID=UPI003404ECE7
MSLADAHLHLFARGFAGRYGRSPAGGDELRVYEDLRRVHGIGRALVVGYEGEPRYAGNNDHVVAVAREHSWIAPLVHLPPDGPAAPDVLPAWLARGAAGVAVYLPGRAAAERFAGWSPATVDVLNLARAVVSLNATPAALAAARRPLARLDGCAVLVSHLGLPGRYARPPTASEAQARLAPLLALADLPYFHVKVSGLYAISDPAHVFPHHAADPFAAAVLDRFGPRRLLWGSDFPPCLDDVSFAQALELPEVLDVNPDERADIMGANLDRVLAGGPR